MADKIIWLIDEDEDELRTYAGELKAKIKDGVEVRSILPFQDMQEYSEKILSHPSTAAIVTDHKLTSKGTVDYTGIELAEYLRGVNAKLPIYILTSYAHDTDEFEGKELNVEYIIDKKSFNDDEETNKMIARILRHIDVHEEIVSNRAQRFSELLHKSLDEDLAEGEYKELEELRYVRSSSILAGEIAETQKLVDIISLNNKLIEQIKGKANGS